MRVLVLSLLIVVGGCGQVEEKKQHKSQPASAQDKTGKFSLSREEKAQLLRLARLAIQTALKKVNDDPTFFRRNTAEGRRIIEEVLEEVTRNFKPSENLKRKCGVFVTLRTPRLKPDFCGCLGIFEPELPLYKQVPERAMASAFYDSRFWGFRDVTTKFLKEEVKIEVSVLTPPRPARIDEVVLGKHGVLVMYHGRGGTYLPIVGEELRKDGEIKTGRDFVIHCVKYKAGLPPSVINDADFKLFVYEALRFEEE